ncbi:MAG: futalosine hydrolase [Chitinophagales bacterium]|nr:futalosine hydrolase [Chitinophagales bacterium]
MKITLVFATKLEAVAFINHFDLKPHQSYNNLYVNGDLHLLITGIGMLQTATHLMHYALHFNSNFYFNLGIAGAFNRTIALTEVVQVNSETYGDFGVENDEEFEDFFEMGFLEQSTDVFSYGLCRPIIDKIHEKIALRKVSSITVNKVHGNEKNIAIIQEKYKADIENMEGLAFYYVLNVMQKPSIEIRSISNYVEKRNKNNWKIKEAIDTLLLAFLEIYTNIK